MRRLAFDPSVYFVADPSCCAGRDVVDVVMHAVVGGVTMVQLRNKSGNMPEFLAQAAMLGELLQEQNIPFIINDSLDVAFAVGADGVHLGQEDTSPAQARARLGEQVIIGQTVFTAQHIEALDPAVDYIGTGPFYVTKTEKGKPVLGPQNFSVLARRSPVPVVGIGGITPENAATVIKSGAHGVAMMRSISEALDPGAAARAFVAGVGAAREEAG
ncbi:MAG: thiamine phosphate synthase [Alphaproteobacteria bacterium]|nr:thiamine phosphate synthase [Alphaproteobacteria bacterium]